MIKVTPMPDNLVSTAFICEKLGITRQAIWNFRQQGMPVAWRSGRIIRYSYVDVLNWLDKRNNKEI